jgi:co-chaperonin GroES (HSP10)
VNTSRTFAFADGLSSGERDGMLQALGPAWAAKVVPAEALAVDLLAARQPEEEAAFRDLNRVAWEIITEAFSNRVITPGVTRTEDVVWWMRQRLADLGLSTWFQPSVEIQRQFGSPDLVGVNPVIRRGDVLHCDFGVTALGLNTDTQHMGYVLRDGETEVPAGLRQALANSNRLQDFSVAALRPGRTGNEVLAETLRQMKAAGIDGTVYSHPIGLHGHGAAATTASSPACGTPSSCRPPPRSPSGGTSWCARPRKRTSSSAPTGRSAGPSGGRPPSTWSADPREYGMRRNSKRLIVVGDRVLVKTEEGEQRSKVGLYLPPTAVDSQAVQGGEIVSTGPGLALPELGDQGEEPWKVSGAGREARFVPMQAQVGDFALFFRKAAVEISFEGAQYLVVPQAAILALVREPREDLPDF